MSDPLGLIGKTITHQPGFPHSRGVGGVGGVGGLHPSDRAGQPSVGFNEVLKQQINQVNQLQQDANKAVEDLAAGRRDDLESVIIATEKADIAFKMLLQVRNKVMDAYEEVKQIRV